MFHGPIPVERYYSYLTWRDIDTMSNKINVILIQPIGAIEQHGAHLPLITDDAIGLQVIGKTLEQFCSNANPIIYVLPPQHSGRSTEHISFPGTISLNATTLTNVLMDIGESVYRSGFRKLIFFNSHGGQPQIIEIVSRDLRQRYSDFLLFPIFLWHLPNVSQTLVTPYEFKCGIHAGDIETSLMLTFMNNYVKMNLAKKEYPSMIKNEGDLLGIEGGLSYAWITKDLSQSGVIGDPTEATKEKGEQILLSLILSFKKLLEEIHLFHF
jgi:creatinine amidohydrolase